MNRISSPGIRQSVASLAVTAFSLGAVPAMAASYTQPYYDPVRDVMVTPRMATSGPAQEQSQTSSTSARAPIYGTYYTPPTGAAVIQSSPGAVGVTSPTAAYPATTVVYPATTVERTRSVAGTVEPYYDAARDVMVTPSMSGTVPYVGSSRGYSNTHAAQPASTFELVLRNGRLVEGPVAIAVEHGSEVTMIVDSDVADALRIDGYNLVAPVVPGQPMLLTFVAEQPGRFAYRMGSGREIGVIEVGPPRPAGTSLGMR